MIAAGHWASSTILTKTAFGYITTRFSPPRGPTDHDQPKHAKGFFWRKNRPSHGGIFAQGSVRDF